MKMNRLTNTSLICLLFISIGVIACSDDNGRDINDTAQDRVLFSVSGEELVSVDDMVTESSSSNVEHAQQEDLDLLEQSRNDLLSAAQDLSDRYSGGNGTYNRNVSYKIVTLNYLSIDGKGNPITLSGKLTLPMVGGKYIPIEDILLHCHATNLDMTGKGVSPNAFKGMAAYSFAVIDPDYIGFGVTYEKPQTYLCHKLIARQCVDMELAAIEYMKSLGIELKEGYGTYVLGYSQGGGNSMAVGRHLQETDHGLEANKTINVKGLYCGAGPYSPIGTFQHWLESDSLSFSGVLSMVIKGQQEGHSDIMAGTNLLDYFSQDYLESGIPQAFETNSMSNIAQLLIGDLNLQTIRYPEPAVKTPYDLCLILPWMQFSKIMSPAFADPQSSMRLALLECLSEEAVDDWVPNMPVEIYTAPRDNVIPVKENAYSTYQKFRDAGAPDVTLSLAGDLANHITGQLAWVNHVKLILKNL